MKNKLAKLVFLFITFLSYSQTDPLATQERSLGGVFERMIDINQRALAFGLTEAQFESIKNEAYVNKNFLRGNIYQDEQLIKNDILMRYNAYADQIEIKKDDSEIYGGLMKDPSIYVKILNDIYVFIPFEGSNDNGGYFNILSEGKKYSLYKKVTAKYIEPKVAKTSYDRNLPPSFTKSTTYYLVENGRFYELPSKESKILKVMDGKKKEIKEYMKRNDLDLDEEKDLINVVSYFDSLQ
ncbi:hypothetical protein [Aequorivita echinoideorum]|uniref:GLPGLI family protein n=1 Tax=Aequorivita echinoideorum TaxID=1549647 RepID=A0ABS5S5K8_9FLAO|nr:hypothetical protein [Aequorivita echinoideorum]MBT0607694.1 hypothetical protein [Aequorivita echinoideorum]